MLKMKIGGFWGVFGWSGGTASVSSKFLIVQIVGITADKFNHSPILSLFKKQKFMSLYRPVIERN